MGIQVQSSNINNQTSFGMLKFQNKTKIYKILEKFGKLDEFKKAEPILEDLSLNHDITVKLSAFGDSLNYIATPMNKLKMNNSITRSVYGMKHKVGESTAWFTEQIGKNAFIRKGEQAIEDLQKHISANNAPKNAAKTKKFIEEYYATHKGLVGGPLMSDDEKFKQIVWHSTHVD